MVPEGELIMRRGRILHKWLSAVQIVALALGLSLGSGSQAPGQTEAAASPAASLESSAVQGPHDLRVVLYTEATSFTFTPGHTSLVAGDTATFVNYDAVSQRLLVRQAGDERMPQLAIPVSLEGSGRSGTGAAGDSAEAAGRDDGLDLSVGPILTPILQTKQAYSHTFTAAGTYEVLNADYSGQVAHVVVSEGETTETKQSYDFSRNVVADVENMLKEDGAAEAAGPGAAGQPGDSKAIAAVPGTTCPLGAPTKTFTILAIDVDITLNRFGYHDPQGKMYVLEENLAAVRAQETAALPNRIQLGLRDDPIQPLVVRANLGDCVNVTFKNQLGGGAPASIDLHRGQVDPNESGSSAGNNANSIILPGSTTTYTWFLENKPEMEGTMYLHSMGDTRAQTAHGLFGALIAETQGATYLHPKTGAALKSGWEAMIVPLTGPAFREFTVIYHEIGDEAYILKDAANGNVPLIDPVTEVYRPGARALNYRSEPHGLRVALAGDESHAYGSYTYGDPPTPLPFSYLGDPYKTRLLHGGSEVFHSHHYHGGTVRWPLNPKADPAFAVQRGFDKNPPLLTQSTRLDVQNIGPGESYELEHECVSGGCQQVAGEFLYHCHFPNHYVGGMWSFYRVYNTLQPGLQELPDRQGRTAAAVNSLGLIGKATPGGRVLTKDTLDAWVESFLPPQGVTSGTEDATVYDWIKTTSAQGSLYFKEAEDTRTWVDFSSATPGQRPEIKFDPNTGLLEFPFLTPHLGKRPPYAPGAHGGAPFLMTPKAENNLPTNNNFTTEPPDPDRPDALCPAGSPIKRFNIVGVPLPIPLDSFGTVDPGGQIFVLAEEVDDVLAGRKPATSLVVRANARDCVYLTYVSRFLDTAEVAFFSKTNLHPHFYQFDTQASDGVISGFSWEQSVRPYPTENRTLAQNVAAGSSIIQVTNVTNLRPGIWIGVSLGDPDIELHKIASISGTTVTLVEPLVRAHSAGEAVGTEFVSELWYPDVTGMSTVFAHDHVYGTHSWGHGLVSSLVVEPPGSTYHDPTTGLEIRSGPVADIHTTNPVAIDKPGQSFREVVVQAQDTNEDGRGSFNLRREPFVGRLNRNGDPSLLFSSVTHGDPATFMPRAYQGDPTVFRFIQTGTNESITFHLTGHDFRLERFPGATVRDVAITGIAERFDLILEEGAGRAGDYMFYNSEKDHLEEGMWGIFRVHDTLQSTLRPLPDRPAPPGGAGFPNPALGQTQTGGRPPAAGDSGNPCPTTAPVKQFDIVAMQLTLPISTKFGLSAGGMQIFAWTADEADFLAGRKTPRPLVLWAAQGDCMLVNLTNHIPGSRVSLHSGIHTADPQRSQGITVGYNFDQSVATNQSITYRLFAKDEMGHGMLLDFANGTTGMDKGLYGAISVGPPGAKFIDPVTDTETKFGWEVVTEPTTTPFLPRREFVLFFHEQDSQIGKNTMPYPVAAGGLSLLNYKTEPLARRLVQNPDKSRLFSTPTHGDPETAVLETYAGDPFKVHVMQGTGFQTHTFFMDGHSYAFDPHIPRSNQFGARMYGPLTALHATPPDGAGGPRRLVGDYVIGNHRMPFLEAGQWGLLRVMSPGSAELDNLPNKAPVAAVDTVTVQQNTTNNPVNVLANDSDPDGHTITVDSVTQPANGTAAVAADPTDVLYTPNAGFSGTDAFTYTNTDGHLRATATVTVSVVAANRAPVAANDAATVPLNSAAQVINVLANDSDPDGNPLTVSAATQPAAGGAVAIGLTGTNVVFTPTAAFSGATSFTYTASDGSLTASATVNVTVSVINSAPVAVDDTVVAPQNSVNERINVLANDTDPDGNPLRVLSVTASANGSVAVGVGGTRVIYTPASAFAGTDTFSYTVTDGALTDSGTVTVTVSVANSAPSAANDTATVLQGSSVNPIDVLANDTDINGNPLAVTSAANGASGSVSVSADRSDLTYTPNAGFIGIDSFTYNVSDGALSAAGRVTVTVQRNANRAPLVVNDTASVAQDSASNPIDVLFNDSDPDGDAIRVSGVTQGINGAVAIGTGGANVLYTPRTGVLGADTFTYTASDGALTATATITVTVTPRNQPPVAVNDSVVVPRNSANNILNVLDNDNDPNGDAVRVTAVTQGAKGTVTVGAGGANVIYTPAANTDGADSFTYTISDGSNTATATVVVNVRRENSAPVAVGDTATVNQDTVNNSINVLANDRDPEGNPLSVISVSPASQGLAAIAAGGTNVLYTPTAGFAGTDSFTYTVTDGSLTATATVSVTVSPPIQQLIITTRILMPVVKKGAD